MRVCGGGEPIGGFVRTDHQAAGSVEGQTDQPRTGQDQLGLETWTHAVETVRTGQRVYDEERSVRIEGETLRPAESGRRAR